MQQAGWQAEEKHHKVRKNLIRIRYLIPPRSSNEVETNRLLQRRVNYQSINKAQSVGLFLVLLSLFLSYGSVFTKLEPPSREQAI